MSKGAAVWIGVLSALVYAAPPMPSFGWKSALRAVRRRAPDYKQEACLGYVMGVTDVPRAAVMSRSSSGSAMRAKNVGAAQCAPSSCAI
jgi:hypothetical protein